MPTFDLTGIFTIILTIVVALYVFFTRKFNHWKRKNVPFAPPVPFFGNVFEVLTLRKNIGELLRNLYESTTLPFLGFFICDQPCLLIRDPELIKTVLVKDFNIFDNHNLAENKQDDPMGSHMLIFLRNPEWRDIRKKITPCFSSGKLKAMHKLLSEAGADFVKYLEEEVEKNPVIDSKEAAAKYSTESITSTSFGINANCFKDENAEFRVVSRRIYNFSILERAISTSFYFLFPNLVKLFRLKFIDKASSDFLRKVFWQTMQEREEKKIVRNDLLDILIEMKNEEYFSQLEGDKLVAQAATFFIAGFETTSTTVSFTLYEFALNPEIQKKVREEILNIINKFSEISYDSLNEMKYLELCIKETLRKYPPLPFLDRISNRDYQIPGTDVILEKGTPVFISTFGLHYNAEYYPNPEKYDPLRFTKENIQLRPVSTYLPFGDGPRVCLGDRYGFLSSKTAVAHLISKFEVELCDKTQHPLKMDPKGFALSAVSGLFLKFKKVE